MVLASMVAVILVRKSQSTETITKRRTPSPPVTTLLPNDGGADSVALIWSEASECTGAVLWRRLRQTKDCSAKKRKAAPTAAKADCLVSDATSTAARNWSVARRDPSNASAARRTSPLVAAAAVSGPIVAAELTIAGEVP